MNLNLFIEEQKKIVITGATGWVGQNFLYELQKLIPQEIFNDVVIAFGSREKVISSSAYKIPIKIKIHSLDNIKDLLIYNKDFVLIHTAFLTREKIKIYGVDEYIKINNKIIKTIEQILSLNGSKKSLLISSGAVENINEVASNINILKEDPYGYLKFKEEEVFKKSQNSLILRIYGLTGKFIRDPEIFAFGNFLLSAKKNQAIKIKSQKEVIRSYVYGGDIAISGLRWISSRELNDNILLNAATHTVSLLDLANKITKIFSLPKVEYSIDKNLGKNIYRCENKGFQDFLRKLDIKPTTMNKQILETYSYLKK